MNVDREGDFTVKIFTPLFSIALLASLSACSTTQVKASPKAAVTAPGKALNLDKKTIPANLTNLDNPYDITGASDCASIGAQIAELTEFAGPDWDSPEHFSKSGRTSEEFFNAVLPYGGIVSFISGASEHEKKVLYATSYASVKRAALKSKGARLGCSAPAAPLYGG